MMRKFIKIMILSLFCCAAIAQISTEEPPASWQSGIGRMTMPTTTIPMFTLPSFDVEALLKEDEENENFFLLTPSSRLKTK